MVQIHKTRISLALKINVLAESQIAVDLQLTVLLALSLSIRTSLLARPLDLLGPLAAIDRGRRKTEHVIAALDNPNHKAGQPPSKNGTNAHRAANRH